MSASSSTDNARIEPGAVTDGSILNVHSGLLHDAPVETAPGGYSLALLLLLAFMSVLILASSVYFVNHRGGFSPLVTDLRVGPLEPTVAAGPMSTEEMVKKGTSLFGRSCIQCHQATGLGVEGKYPPLAGSDIINGSEEKVIRIVLNGLKGPITVKNGGAPFITGELMPWFAPGKDGGLYNWSDANIAYALTYVRQAFGNTSPPITPEKVAEIHKLVGNRQTQWTEAELPK
jgi:mono/diheme cytochrome c family protein